MIANESLNSFEISELISSLDHLINVFYPQNKDPLLLDSILEKEIDLFFKLLNNNLKILKENKEIKVVPNNYENKLAIILEKRKNKWSKKDIELMKLIIKANKEEIYKSRLRSLSEIKNIFEFLKRFYV